MATFRLPAALPERKDPDIIHGHPALPEDNDMRIWAYSPRRTKWQMSCAFLDAGYGDHKYQMYGIYDNPDGTLKVKFVNFRDAHLLYGQAFHYGYEMVVFTGSNIFTNYWNRFPNSGNFIHSVLVELPMAPEVPPCFLVMPPMAQEVPSPSLEVPMSQEPTLLLELSLVPMSRAAAGGTD